MTPNVRLPRGRAGARRSRPRTAAASARPRAAARAGPRCRRARFTSRRARAWLGHVLQPLVGDARRGAARAMCVRAASGTQFFAVLQPRMVWPRPCSSIQGAVAQMDVFSEGCHVSDRRGCGCRWQRWRSRMQTTGSFTSRTAPRRCACGPRPSERGALLLLLLHTCACRLLTADCQLFQCVSPCAHIVLSRLWRLCAGQTGTPGSPTW